MLFRLECKKIKRTGFLPALLGGGILAGAVPVLHMALRPSQYVSLPGSPVNILLDANWQMMAMLNLLLVTVLACLLYSNEYTDHALLKMNALPISGQGIFLGKCLLLALGCLLLMALEGASCAFCCLRWFSASDPHSGSLLLPGLWSNATELVKNFGYALLLLLPTALTALLIASLCENMWISLGICVLCVFVATMIPADHFVLSLFPFALAFSTLSQAAGQGVLNNAAAAIAECLLLIGAKLILLKIRRSFS